ncbi:MAG: DUF1501 domain-containing protein [Gemmataceae bacterium]
MRDRYGRHKFGQGTLLARCLHGARCAAGHRLLERRGSLRRLGPALSQPRAACHPWPRRWIAPFRLLDDLQDRGLLDETLVVWMGEFGRAPLIEREGGRGHWARCYSVVLAGAGIKPGIVHGRSDRHAAYPVDGAVTPQDVVTTMYHCLGVPTDTELSDALGRPYKLCQGRTIQPVLE